MKLINLWIISLVIALLLVILVVLYLYVESEYPNIEFKSGGLSIGILKPTDDVPSYKITQDTDTGIVIYKNEIIFISEGQPFSYIII